MLQKYNDTNFITGIRAIAALGVVLIHSGGGGLRELGPLGNSFADLGATGVYVFFVISGFSVATSFEGSKGYGDYLRKRALRIVPLYFFWIAACFIVDGASIYNLLMHLSFLSFLDYGIANSIVWVEWSIPIEVFYYLILPAAIVFCTTPARVILLCIAAYGVNRLGLHLAPHIP